ncbi:MAG TPA: hypothetical protein VGK67_19405 [Myxococcales bacterium]|jgi:hypothetical protein
MRRAAVVGLAFASAVAVAFEPRAAEAGEPPFAVSVEGGVGHYTGALGSSMKLGGVWGVRAEGFVSPAFEVGLAYVGGANQVGAGDAMSQPVLQRDGGEATVKAMPLEGPLRPYLEAGAGMTHFHVRGGNPGADVHGATTFTVPVALGVQANAGVLRLGAAVGGELLVGDKPVDPGGGVRLDATLNLGARF